MIRPLIRDVRIWWFSRKLNRLVAKQQAQFEAAHPDYAARRKAALRHQPRIWA